MVRGRLRAPSGCSGALSASCVRLTGPGPREYTRSGDQEVEHSLKLRELLQQYDDSTLESLAADKVDDVIHLRLPKDVLVDEIADTIASYSYVSAAVGTRHPPCFEILDLLMKADGFRLTTAGFKKVVQERIAEIASVANSDEALALDKDYELYLRILETAWEDDRVIDASEASILTALRRELGISFREHIVLEHSSRIRPYWQTPEAYEKERNHLLAAGILHTHEGCYMLPEELPPLVREAWSIELPQADYRRLLERLNTRKLYELLGDYGLKVAGTKDERIDRLVSNYVEPGELMEKLMIGELRELARNSGARVSGTKDEVIDNLIQHFLLGRDLEDDAEAPEPIEIEPEPKVLDQVKFRRLFAEITVENLYEIAGKLRGIQKSGSKRERIEAAWASPYSEATLLGALTNSVLSRSLRGLGLPLSGPKDEKIARLLDWAQFPGVEEIEPETVDEPEAPEPEEETLPERKPSRPAERPEGFEEIRARFPFLDEDQQTVLAALRQLRSLNEHELDRLVARYNLDWFLTKAEMLELMERLSDADAPVMRIRARGEHNVYEYVEG